MLFYAYGYYRQSVEHPKQCNNVEQNLVNATGHPTNVMEEEQNAYKIKREYCFVF